MKESEYLRLTHVVDSIPVKPKAVLAVRPINQSLDPVPNVFGQLRKEYFPVDVRHTQLSIVLNQLGVREPRTTPLLSKASPSCPNPRSSAARSRPHSATIL